MYLCTITYKYLYSYNFIPLVQYTDVYSRIREGLRLQALKPSPGARRWPHVMVRKGVRKGVRTGVCTGVRKGIRKGVRKGVRLDDDEIKT